MKLSNNNLCNYFLDIVPTCMAQGVPKSLRRRKERDGVIYLILGLIVTNRDAYNRPYECKRPYGTSSFTLIAYPRLCIPHTTAETGGGVRKEHLRTL